MNDYEGLLHLEVESKIPAKVGSGLHPSRPRHYNGRLSSALLSGGTPIGPLSRAWHASLSYLDT